ncbi:MAG: IPT/TIG domain-containing protein [Anaerolineae bacterium]
MKQSWSLWFVVALACVTAALLFVVVMSPVNASTPQAAPTLTALSPTSAPNDLVTQITITGTGFAQVPTVSLGSEVLAEVGWISADLLTATVPWGLAPAVYDLTVANPSGESATMVGALTLTQGIGVWTTGGPYGGQVNFIAQNPSDPQTLYAAAQWVGVFESQDSGGTWEPILQIGWPTRLRFDAADADVIYVSGDSADFFKTTDGGENWERIPNLFDSQNGCYTVYVATHPITPGIVYAGAGSCADIPLLPGEGGVFYSEDQGANWITRTNGLTDTDVIDLAFDPANSDNMLVATMSGNIFATIDGGENWSWQAKIEDGLRRIYYNPHVANQYWAIPLNSRFGGSEPQHSLYKSSDLTTWDGVDLPSGTAEVWNLTFEPNGIWAASNFGYFSDDGGQTWSVVMADQPASGGITDFIVDAGDANLIHAGEQERAFFQSSDGGTTWQASNTGLAALNPRDVAAANIQPDTVYANISGLGLIRSYNGGASWQELGVGNGGGNASGPLLALDPFVQDRVYYDQHCSGAGPCFWYSTDAGDSWSEVPMPVPVTYTGWISSLNLIAPHPLVSGTLYASVRFSHSGSEDSEVPGLYRSRDYGQEWQYLGATVTMSEVLDLAFDCADPDLLYATTDGSGLWRSTDGGELWTHLPISNALPPVMVPAIATHPDIPRQVYIRTYSFAESPNPEPELWLSADAGDTWQPMAYVFTGVDLLVAPPWPDLPAYSLYTGCQPGLCRSLDDGDTWAPIEGAPRPEILTAVSDGERSLIYLGTPGSLLTAEALERTPGRNTTSSIPGRGSLLGGGVYRYTTVPAEMSRVWLPLVVRSE